MTSTHPHRRLSVVHLPVDALAPNPWNPNRVPPAIMIKLREYIRREGLVEPLIVRRLSDHYQILGGFHRWTICKDELGYTEVPCVVVDVDDKRAKILTVNLNELSGDPVPELLADLVHDLADEMSFDDLAAIMPFTEGELIDFDNLLAGSDELDAFLEQEAEAREEEPKTLTFTVANPTLINEAITLASAELTGRGQRGQALEILAQAYLDHQGGHHG